MCCSVLQCVVVCSVLQCKELVSVEEKDVTILSCHAIEMSRLLQCVAVCVAVCCSVQCVAV